MSEVHERSIRFGAIVLRIAIRHSAQIVLVSVFSSDEASGYLVSVQGSVKFFTE